MKPSIIFVLEHGAWILLAAPKEAHFCEFTNKNLRCRALLTKCTSTHENQRILIFRAEMKSLFHFMLRQGANTKDKEGFIIVLRMKNIINRLSTSK